jgi:molecular chaperone DnaJ
VDKPCKNCAGTGVERARTKLQVKIPAGADDGQSLRLRGEGNTVQGGRAGDLFVRIRLKPHQYFKREGENVLYETKISFPKAALGGELEVPIIEGKASLKIPPGTKGGTVFRLEGKGFPEVDGYGRGDQLVRVDVDIPRELNKRERELLQEFARQRGENL